MVAVGSECLTQKGVMQGMEGWATVRAQSWTSAAELSPTCGMRFFFIGWVGREAVGSRKGQGWWV